MPYPNLTDIVVANVDPTDAPDYVDAYVQSARWEKTGELLTDPQVDYINENYPEIAQENAFESLLR